MKKKQTKNLRQPVPTLKQWQHIEQEFMKWDQGGKFNASQNQILDWFKKTLKIS